MDITTGVIKYVLFVCNLLSVILGLLLFIAGCLVTFTSNDIATRILRNNNFTIVGIFLIFIGLCIFSLTFFGCWGAFYEKYSMLITYGVLLLVLLLLQLILYGIVLYFSNKDSNDEVITTIMEKIFKNYKKNKDREFVNEVQTYYSCCGVDGPDFWHRYHLKIPPSCCNSFDQRCDFSNAFRLGCLEAFKNDVASKFHLSYIFVSLVFQILVIGSTFYLARALRTDRIDYDAI